MLERSHVWLSTPLTLFAHWPVRSFGVSRTVIVGLWTTQTWIFGQIYSTRHVSSCGKGLYTREAGGDSWHLCQHCTHGLAALVITVVHRGARFDNVSSWQPTQHLLVGTMNANDGQSWLSTWLDWYVSRELLKYNSGVSVMVFRDNSVTRVLIQWMDSWYEVTTGKGWKAGDGPPWRKWPITDGMFLGVRSCSVFSLSSVLFTPSPSY